MNIIFSVGILIFTGFIFGELAVKAKLPKISGYILAGILLNPDLLGIMSSQFVEHTNPLISISLSFITFSIGGSLSYANLKATGRKIIILTLYESLFAFFVVFLLIFFSLNYFIHVFNSVTVIIVISLILASLAAPTDPSATLAVTHEYKAKGIVSSSMMEIAAFDDITGIIIYTLASVLSSSFLGGNDIEFTKLLIELSKNIGGAVIIGAIIGFMFNYIVKVFRKETDGTLIVLTFGLVLLSYGISDYLGFEALLSSMALGVVVTNWNPAAERILKLIDRYTDELIFVIFFTLSGLHMQLSSISGNSLLILIYIIGRAIGKFSGIYIGSIHTKANPKVKKYAAGGLIPQGGIVIGLALLLVKDPMYKDIASTIIGIVIAAALVNEISGPVFSKFSLIKAGEIKK